MESIREEPKEQELKKRKRPTVRAVKPGTYSDYLRKHPEVVDAGLREMGIDPDELDRLLDEGPVLIDLNNFKGNAKITKIKEEA